MRRATAIPKDRQAVTFRTKEDRDNFAHWLDNEVRQALQARSAYVSDGGLLDTWHTLYEQGQRARHRRPWPDAADLASYIPTEKVDALRARLVQVVFRQDPICTVEGWGEETARVAKVEAFHQWKAEDERLQKHVAKALHQALIEGNGILEVTERLSLKKTQGPMQAKMLLDEELRPVLGDDLQPQPARDEGGAILAWSGDENEPHMQIQRERIDFAVRGPQYRVLSLKDFLFLPAHANDNSELWGYAKRIHLRLPDLEQRVRQGLYDAEAVQGLGLDGERDTRAEHARQGLTVAEQQGPTAEKELWEVSLLYDIDGDGIEEWLICCYSLKHQQLLRCAYDQLEQVRYVDLCPFPRATSVYGYSFVGNKIWTIADEHTALRNMKADRQALALAAPLLRLTTSIWDPDDQPFGPGAVIDVRTAQDISQLPIADVPASTIESERTILGAAERVSGLGDTAVSGVQPDVRRTATEHNYAAQGSFVRIDEAVVYVQEAIEELYQLRHVLWQRALLAEEAGLSAPDRVLKGLEVRGIEMPKGGPFKFTAQDLAGSFRFKPRGSTENADKNKLRADLGEFMSGLQVLMQLFPPLAMVLQTNPAAAKELLEQMLRLWNFPNLQPFLQMQPQVAAPQGVGPEALPAPMGGPAPGLAAQLPAILASLRGAQPGQVM